MSSRSVRIDIDRIVVTGAQVAGLDPAQLRVLVQEAVVGGLARSSLPAGRVVQASIQVQAPALGTGNGPLSRTVGAAVVNAVNRSHGAGRHG